MKLLVQIALWLVIAFLGYKVYDSVYSSVRFQELKEERFALAVEKLKEIRTAQLAHKTVTGKYARTFENLASFIDTAQFAITQRRDSSFIRFDKEYRIDKVVDTFVVDILGYSSIKDSLFKNSDRYKKLDKIEVTPEKTVTIDMRTSIIEKNSILFPVFEAVVKKRDLLYDQDEDYLKEEDQVKSIEGIKGTTIYVGTLEEINTNGNWPLVYDK